MIPALFPVPAKSEFSRRAPRRLADCRWILVDTEFSPVLVSHARALAARFAGLFASGLDVTLGFPAAGRVLLRIVTGEGQSPQAYRLICGADGLRLEATGEAGAFYGLQTLAQVLDQCGAMLPDFEIEDAPDFPARGVMLDISRCKVPTLETLKGMLDVFAAMKLNQVQLYTEHTFAFSAHAPVWADASPLTPAEVQILDGWCRERYIELVPNFNSFGHFERWLRHPEYRHYAECPDGFEYPWGGRTNFGSTLKPDAESLELLESLFDELLPNFSSSLFNVGCDETWELGLGWSKARCEKIGKTRVYLDFLKRIQTRVKARGRRMMFWGDIILHQPELVKELPRDVVALEWGYEADHPFEKHARLFAASHIPFYVCPGTSSWNSLTGRTANMLGNLENAAINGAKNGANGFLVTDWGDGGHHQYPPVSWPGYAAGAAYSWNLAANRKADLAGALDRLVFHDQAGVMGRLCLDLGRVLELVPMRTFNSSIFNHLLFWNMKDKVKLFDPLRAGMLKKCVARFDDLESRLLEARPEKPDGVLAVTELRNAIGMARHGARRGIAARQPPADRGDLRRDLLAIIRLHEALWLARNRPGGLHESSERLRGALAPLK